MLDKARAKAVYDELKLGDVATILGEYRHAFDLAICTDVMIYLGNLTPIFASASLALKRGALFAFTVEVLEGEGFALDKSGRYLHSRSYVESVVATHGFELLHCSEFVARYEGETPDVHNLFIVKHSGERVRRDAT
jgi:predicted TPR repeat methyltransferase